MFFVALDHNAVVKFTTDTFFALPAQGWQTYQVEYQIPETWDRGSLALGLQFETLSAVAGRTYRGYLDNVLLQQIPEPSVGVLLGFGGAVLLAVLVYRRLCAKFGPYVVIFSVTPAVSARFSGWSLPAGVGDHFHDASGRTTPATFRDCQLRGGALQFNFYPTGETRLSALTLLNNLVERAALGLTHDPDVPLLGVEARNNLFRRGSVLFGNEEVSVNPGSCSFHPPIRQMAAVWRQQGNGVNRPSSWSSPKLFPHACEPVAL